MRAITHAVLPALAIPLLLAAGLAHAQVYKWKDANGRTIYSDTPPPNQVEAQQVRVPGAARRPAAAGTASGSDDRAAASRRDDEEASRGDSGAPTAAQCANASLARLREMGCRVEQAGCPGLREYQRETLDTIARGRNGGEQSAMSAEFNAKATEHLAGLLRNKGC
ncbi:DUF4124 domain-containing protein [Montanilutibacter psychrotolerans]|nr:DUF4124 domain-containing protein [Lysobacter psychrotolerans]